MLEAFNLTKVGVMFGFTKRHEHEWRIRRLEENDKQCLALSMRLN